MDATLHPRPAALLHSAERHYLGTGLARRLIQRLRRSPALASVLPVLLTTGLVSAVAVAALQLSLLGAIDGFAGHWFQNWLLTWAIASPVAYVAGPLLQKLAGIVTVDDAPTELVAPQPVDTRSAFEGTAHASGLLAARRQKAWEYLYLG